MEWLKQFVLNLIFPIIIWGTEIAWIGLLGFVSYKAIEFMVKN